MSARLTKIKKIKMEDKVKNVIILFLGDKVLKGNHQGEECGFDVEKYGSFTTTKYTFRSIFLL